MRDVTIGEKTFKVRPLKRGEVRALREEGLDLYLYHNLLKASGEEQDQFLDRVCPNQREAIDDLDNDQAMELLYKAWCVTWGFEEERKNSEPSGAGTQEAEPTTAEVA